MALFKYTLILEGPAHGASETLYVQRPNGTSLQDVATWVSQIKYKRQVLLGAEWWIKGDRLCLVKDDAGLPVKRVTIINKYYLPGVSAQPAEDTGTSLQVLMSDRTRVFKKLAFLAGAYRSIFPFGDSYVPAGPGTGNWQTNFQSYASLLITLGMGWLAGTPQLSQVIQSYQFSSATGLTTYTLKAPGIAFGQAGSPVRVSVEFPLSKSPLDGVQIVIPASDTVVTTAKPRPASPFLVDGRMTLKGSTFISLEAPSPGGPAGTVEGQNPMNRKRGRPLLVSRGRLPARPLW